MPDENDTQEAPEDEMEDDAGEDPESVEGVAPDEGAPFPDAGLTGPTPPRSQSVCFDYNRTVVGFHGTRRDVAERLVNGEPFSESSNDDDWLGHGIYFWEHAPQQAWWWAQRKYGENAAVVGAMIRLGSFLDFLDPQNSFLLERSHQSVVGTLSALGTPVPRNANNHKYLDCLVFNNLSALLAEEDRHVDGIRAVFVPQGRVNRFWERSGVYRGSHIQLCVRSPENIVSVWHVKRDGRYGVDARTGGPV